jgi:NAD(P)-dependent dehydrogenase (short-subunit alcohol dehydrogenase family)/predicted Ser/Thr protein kinase
VSGSGTVGGRYELGELLGRGGMAEVRKGTDTRLGRVVAVKRLRTDLASDATFQARFRREAQSSASLNHPAIVAVYDTGEEPSADGSGVAQPYIVMEYVAGRTLRDILREGRKILPERALEITSGVLSALDYSHRAGIIHRDIKPGNVMLTPSGDVKVMDFGIARAISDASSTMTQTAAVVGTAQYLSPEQARGETVDSRSDVYSAGCLLYELLTGRPPFVGDSPVAVAYQHVREQAQPPSDHDTDLPPEVDAIVMKALAKRVEDRYQSAAAMRSDIERYLAGRPVQAAAVPPVAVPPAAATAVALAEAGSDVLISARTEAQLDEVAAQVRATGRRCEVVAADLSDLDAVAGLAQAAYDAFGRLDIVVNNVGGTGPRGFLDTSPGYLERAFSFNVSTAHVLTKAAVPLLLKTLDGEDEASAAQKSVVTVSSTMGRSADRGFVAYGTAKAALAHWTRMAAQDLSPRIRVNGIYVGSIMTSALEMVAGDPNLMGQLEGKTPLGRVGEPADIAAGVLYLSSQAGQYLTGKLLEIDGGIQQPTLDLGFPDVSA